MKNGLVERAAIICKCDDDGAAESNDLYSMPLTEGVINLNMTDTRAQEKCSNTFACWITAGAAGILFFVM